MAITILASGTQAATVGVEHTLSGGNITGPRTMTLSVDLVNLQAGDEITLRLKTKVFSGGVIREYIRATYGPIISNQPIAISIPMPVPHEATFTLEQTAGTGRSFDFEILALD